MSVSTAAEQAQGREPARDALVERLFGAALGAFDLMGVYLGDRLGLYRAMRGAGPLTPAELAPRAGIAERYAREWLEQQAMGGILGVVDPDAPDDARRYVLPAGHEEALTEESSLAFVAPVAQLVIACARPLTSLTDAYRSGDGLPFADYGEDLIDSQARFTAPMFDRLLADEWLGAIPVVAERLASDPPARVADIACGEGRSSLAIARGFPKVTVDGVDLDEASVDKARANLAGSGLEDRVRFHCRDAADPRLPGSYDLVFVFESLHDMSRPVDVLAAARALLVPEGCVVVGDERVADRFSLDAGDIERFFYGCSITHCLPVGMTGPEPAGTGTVMRADTVRDYAAAAGLTGFEVLPIENDFYRFYRLTP
jgi:SAM-dependent methyltransferase